MKIIFKKYLYSQITLLTCVLCWENLSAQSISASHSTSSWQSNLNENRVFIENRGQFDQFSNDRIDYSVQSGDERIYFTKTGLIYLVTKFEKEEEEHDSEEESRRTETYQLNFEWIGSNANAIILAEGKSNSYFTYGEINTQTSIKANGYSKLIYKNLYDGIDAEYIINKKEGIKYSLIIHPGADPSQIKYRYKGQTHSYLDHAGNLKIGTRLGDLTEFAPVTYDQRGRQVRSHFKLVENEIGFEIENFHRGEKYVIDPWVVSPFGGGVNAVNIEHDVFGNTFVHNGTLPSRISKYNVSGVLQWTYTETSAFGFVGDIAIDVFGNSYLSEGCCNGRIIKLDQNGNVIWNVPENNILREYWTMAQDKYYQSIVVAGGNGGPSSVTKMIANLNTATGSRINYNGFFDTSEGRSLAIAPNGDVYVILLRNTGFGGTPPAADQVLIRSDANFNTLFAVQNNYVFTYTGVPYAPGGYYLAPNALAVTCKYVYTFDGLTIYKRDLTTGAQISSVTVPGGASEANSGIDIDDCGNVYAGSSNGIYKYDSTLAFISSVATPRVYDLTIGNNGDILACGVGFAGSYALSACINNPVSLATSSTPACTGNSNGTAGVVPSGGEAPYTYNWMPGGQTTSSLSGLSAGTYTVIVNDANSCNGGIKDTIITVGTSLYTLSPSTTAASCNGNTGSAGTTVTGGTSPYSYSWSSGSTASTINNLTAGMYCVTVNDGAGCVSSSCVTVANTSGITATASLNTAILCNGGTGAAFVSSSGGTGSHTYTWSSGSTSATANNLSAGTHTVTVTDAGSCQITSTINITQPPAITLTTTSSATSCNFGRVSVSVSGGTGSNYSYAWAATGATSSALDSLNVGTYIVSVTDVNGCIKTASATVAASPSPTATFTQSPAGSVCVGTTVTFTNTGVGNNLRHVWSIGAPINVSGSSVDYTYTFLTAGSYSITHKTYEGTCGDTVVSTINVINCVNPTVTATGNTICNGACATVTSTPGGGSTPYTYLWSNGATTQNINPCPASTTTYTLTITDAGSNTSTTTATVTVNPAVTVSTSPTNITCNGNNNGSASAAPGSGTSPYTYSWSNGQSAQTITGLAQNNYTVTITDNKGCTSTSAAAITEPSAISLTASQNTPATCGSNNGIAVTTAATGGTGSFSYTWSNGSTGLTAGSLVAGNYTVTATDANSCTTTATATINNSPAPTINSLTPTNILCNGNSSGSALVSASGTGTLTYIWTNGNTGLTSTNLSAGTYFVTVTDGSGCKAISSVNITEPSAIATLSVTAVDATCGSSNGSVSLVNPTGGTGVYTYSWSNGATSQNINSLTAANYIVTVTDNNGCTKTASSTIINSGGPSITSVTPTNPLCSGGTGSAVASASGGTGALNYTWNTTASGQTISGLTTGTYTVTVSDANNCANISTVSIAIPTAVSITASQNTAATCSINNGVAVTTASSGGTGPFTYTWSNGSSGLTATTLFAGSYTVTATDANSCTATSSTIINNSPAPTINSLTPTNVLCNGETTGTALVNATGTGTLTYEWSNGSTGLTSSNLNAGTYFITVTDGNGCKAFSSIAITEPTAITSLTGTVTDATCGISNGALALATPTGGTSPYTYAWSNGATTQNINGLAAASYTVTVTDNNGCTKTIAAPVSNIGGPIATASVNSPILCNGSTGSVTVSVANGTSPYTYSWSDGTNAITSSISNSISSLTPATYTVTITDNNNCSAVSTVNLTEPAAISFSAVNSYTTSCGASNGGADVLAVGGTGALSYLWSNAITGQTISSVAAGAYDVTVTDANSCTISTSVLVNNNPSATIDNSTSTNLTCRNSADGSAIVSASGGVGTLTYSWSNGNSGLTMSNAAAGTYVISVTDGSGCLTQSSVVITQPGAITPLTANAVSAACGNSNGSADIKAIGGTGPNYTYSWSSGYSSTGSGTSAISNLAPNTYSCTVTDQNNCSYVHTFVIGDKPSPIFSGSSPTVLPVDCKGNSSGSIDVLITSGTSPYTYNWSTGASSVTTALTSQLTNLSSGNYSLTITDNNGCSVDTALVLSEPSFVFTSTVTAVDATCLAGGSATVNVAGGNTGDYTYLWSNGSSSSTSSANNSITSLSSNTYSVTITDSKGCSSVSSAAVNASGVPTVSASQQASAACGNSNGAALAVGSGTSGYTYSWSNGSSGATVNNLSANTYTVTLTDISGCSSTSTVTITNINGVSVASQSGVGTCVGKTDGSALVTVTGGTSLYTYVWSNGQSGITSSLNHSITSLPAATYTVTITDANNCSSTTSVTVTQYSLPTANAGTDQTITSGTSIQLTATGGTSYLWSPASTLNNPAIDNPLASPTQTTTYTVIVTDANSCSATDDVMITVIEPVKCGALDIFIPTAFSPNNDGQNDILYVRGNQSCITEMFFQVFDRWGEVVFESTSISNSWDGKLEGQPMDSGVFVYRLLGTLTSGEAIDKSGNITLVR